MSQPSLGASGANPGHHVVLEQGHSRWLWAQRAGHGPRITARMSAGGETHLKSLAGPGFGRWLWCSAAGSGRETGKAPFKYSNCLPWALCPSLRLASSGRTERSPPVPRGWDPLLPLRSQAWHVESPLPPACFSKAGGVLLPLRCWGGQQPKPLAPALLKGRNLNLVVLGGQPLLVSPCFVLMSNPACFYRQELPAPSCPFCASFLLGFSAG